MGDQPVPALIDQHDWSGVRALARVAHRGHGGSGEVVGCGLDVGHDEVQRQLRSPRPVQVVIDVSASSGEKPGVTMLVLFAAGISGSVRPPRTASTSSTVGTGPVQAGWSGSPQSA